MATKPPSPKKKPGKAAGRAAYDPKSKNSQMLAGRTGDTYTDKQKDLRDRFVNEYLIDFNATDAYIRAGGNQKNPTQAGYNLKREPYVARAIQAAVDSLDAAKVTNRQRIMAGLVREANHFGIGAAHAARVSAWTRLSSLLGMDQKQTERSLSARGGVMVVPQVESDIDWEKRAQAAQSALKEAVRE